jgi:hypothetical protein
MCQPIKGPLPELFDVYCNHLGRYLAIILLIRLFNISSSPFFVVGIIFSVVRLESYHVVITLLHLPIYYWYYHVYPAGIRFFALRSHQIRKVSSQCRLAMACDVRRYPCSDSPPRSIDGKTLVSSSRCGVIFMSDNFPDKKDP